jgi:hypothetical protein
MTPRTGTWCLMFTVVLAVAGAVTVWPQAPQPKLDLVIDRLMAYTGAYPEALGRIVAEEHYEQRVRHSARSSDGHTAERLDVRITKAELGLAQVGREWVGIRDVVEVDGVAVPDAGRRLERALAQPDTEDAVRAILRDNSRFNVEDSRIGRNINVPTMALEFLRPMHRWRFSFARDGEETGPDRRSLWRIRFRERQRPTLVRQVGGRDQPLRGLVWLDPATGEVFKTDLSWERGPVGSIMVTYGRVERITPLVPLTMSERYADKDGASEILGEARYSNFRQFTTAGRLITP